MSYYSLFRRRQQESIYYETLIALVRNDSESLTILRRDACVTGIRGIYAVLVMDLTRKVVSSRPRQEEHSLTQKIGTLNRRTLLH